MDLSTAITTRRTHKAFGPDPVDDALLDELLDLARWAPNHHLTNPWRFRVLGPRSLHALKQAAGPEGATKLDRAPTMVAVTSRRTPDDPVAEQEDLCATACAVYAILLAAHDRGLAGYWRTPGVLHTPEGRAALGIGDDERFVALVHLGSVREDRRVPERLPLDAVRIRLD